MQGQLCPRWGHPVLDQESHRGQKKLTTHTYKNNLLNIKQHTEKQNENMLWPEKPEQNSEEGSFRPALHTLSVGQAATEASCCGRQTSAYLFR